MHLDLESVNRLTGLLSRNGLLPDGAREYLREMASEGYIFHDQLALSESIHLHIKVASTEHLPHSELVQCGGVPQNSKPGYIKYAFEGGYNFIFSSIPVAEEEQLGMRTKPFPHLDHVGIDMRNEDTPTYACFELVPVLASGMGWPSRRQGGDGNQVSCCHAQVNEKYWVYPPGGVFLEFAFGKLLISNGDFGGDLRPADPALQIASTTCCCGPSTSAMSASETNGGVSSNRQVGRIRKAGIFRQIP
jgi:hypothetical protein